MQKRVALMPKVMGLACALVLLLACMFAAKPAYAAANDKVGNLSVVVAVFDPVTGNVNDGHTYVLFTSYQDGLTLNFSNLYGYYEMDDAFFDAAQKDETQWKFDPSMSASAREALANSVLKPATVPKDPSDPYNRFCRASYQCVLDTEHFITIGDYTMVADEENLNSQEEIARLIQDAIMHSTIVEPWITNGIDIFEDDPKDPTKTVAQKKQEFLDGLKKELETLAANPNVTIAQIQSTISNYFGTHLRPTYAAQVQAALSSRNLYDGATTGGVFVNREMWRQKNWQDMSPVTIYSEDITQQQLDDLMAYVNGTGSNDQNYYSVLAHNCSTFSSGAWNAAVGYVRDASGKNTCTPSPLYIDARDNSYSAISGLFDSPKKMQQVIAPWGVYTQNNAIVHGVKAPPKPTPPTPTPTPTPTPSPTPTPADDQSSDSSNADTSAHGTPKTGDSMTQVAAVAVGVAALAALGAAVSFASLRRREH